MSELCLFVARTLKVDPAVVTEDAGPLTLPAWDSFQHLHLMMAIEEKYAVEIPVEQVVTLLTVADIAALRRAKGANLG